MAAVFSVTAHPWQQTLPTEQITDRLLTDSLYVCLCVYVVRTVGTWKRSLLTKGFPTLNKICNPIQCIHVGTGFTKLVKYSIDIVSPCHCFLWCNPWYSPHAANVCCTLDPCTLYQFPTLQRPCNVLGCCYHHIAHSTSLEVQILSVTE